MSSLGATTVSHNNRKPIPKCNYAQRHRKVIIAINGLHNIPNFSSKLITNKITILNIQNYVHNERKKERKEKRKEGRVEMIILG